MTVYLNTIIEISDAKTLFEDSQQCRELSKKIQSGNIAIIRKVLTRDASEYLLKLLLDSEDFITTNSPAMIEGCCDLRYSSPGSNTKGRYSATDDSRYLFLWNTSQNVEAKAMILPFVLFMLRLNRENPFQILNNTPKDIEIPRIHLIHYPLDIGKITPHVDPVNVCTVNTGIYLSEFGKNYEDGGFHVFDSNHGKVNIDCQVKMGDMVLFYPGMPHFVAPPRRSIEDRAVTQKSGRFFLHMNIVESHHSATRMHTMPFLE